MKLDYFKIKQVEDWEKKPINEKIKVAQEVVAELYEKSKRNFVAWSGGKNSTLALYFAREYDPDILVIFADTGVEIPETYEYIKMMKEKWDLNLIITKPGIGFWTIVKRYGFPDEQLQKYGRLICREKLKVEPVYRVIKRKRLTGHITGLSAFENRSRKMLVARYGLLYKTRSYNSKPLDWDFWTGHPVAYFTDQEVFKTMKMLNIPINPIYEKYKIDRSGCLPCTAHLGWQEQIAKIDKELLKKILKMKGQYSIEDYSNSQG